MVLLLHVVLYSTSHYDLAKIPIMIEQPPGRSCFGLRINIPETSVLNLLVVLEHYARRLSIDMPKGYLFYIMLFILRR